MDEQDLKQAMEHDAARRGVVGTKQVDFLKVAAAHMESASIAARAAAAGLLCKEPAVPEARKMAQLAVQQLEQALVLMSVEAPFDV